MANRFVLKQFAGSATNNGAFGAAQATGAGVQPVANIEDVQSLAAFEQGWNSATLTADKLPALEEMQGLEAILCKAIKENYSEGIPLWINGETYYQHSFVNYNGVIYYNTTGSYTSNNPATDTTNWAQYKPATAGAADTAAVADKLGLSTVGSATQGIYLNNGVPTPMTTGFANQDLSNLSVTGEDHFVTKNTVQTITGAKTFEMGTDSPIVFKNTGLATNGTTPLSNCSQSIGMIANDGSAVGYLYDTQRTDGSYTIGLNAIKNINGSNVTSYLECVVAPDGTPYAVAPVVSNVYAYANEIATAGWCRSSNVHTPNYNSGDLICTNADTTRLPYTCPANGWIFAVAQSGSHINLLVNGGGFHIQAANYNWPFYKVAKGDVITYSSSSGAWEVYFVYNR